MFVEFLLFFVTIVCIFHLYTRCGRTGRLVKNIPGIPAWPLVGSLIPMLGKNQDELWHLFRKFNDDYYPIFKFWTTHEVVVNLRHPDDIEILLSSMQHIDKSTAYRLLHPWLKTGLLTSTGEKWQKRRKILTPAFHFNVLKKYIDIIDENSRKTIEFLKSEIKSKSESIKNLQQLITSHSLSIICETAMGTSLTRMKETQSSYRDAVHKMGDMIVYRIARPWLRNEFIFSLTEKGPMQADALKILHGFSRKIINERLEYHDATEGRYLKQFVTDETYDDENDTKIFGIRKKRLAMLDLLIASSQNGNQIDDDGIQEEVDTFMFEGHDTVAMGLTFVLLLLAEHTDIQTRARNEITDILKEGGGKLTYLEIQRLHYLEMCIKESLRLYPSVPFISRRLSQDLQLKKYLIPAGAIVHVHIYDLHRDKYFWPDPEKFDPERFSPDRIVGRHPFSYIPFSAGPRNCIGQKFAMMELKATIAHLLHNFKLEAIDLAHQVPIRMDLVLRPSRPLKIKMIPIQSS